MLGLEAQDHAHCVCLTFNFYLVSMSVLPICLYVYHMADWCPWRSEGVGPPGTGVMGGCEPLCGCWELNPSPLQEQQVFLMLNQLCRSYNT